MTTIASGTKLYTRVTSITGRFIDLSHIPRCSLENAKIRGTCVHECCEALVSGIGEYDLLPEWKGYIDSFSLWFTDKDFLDKPDRFFCDKLMITGECDFIYQDGETVVLLDIKTSEQESITWPLQGAAYCYLARKRGINVQRIEFLMLSKKGKSPKSIVYEYDTNFKMFMHFYETYRYLYKDKENNDYSDCI